MNKNTIHVGASGILTRKGKVLLGLRSADDSSLPGQWCTPGGGVEPGERINDAIVREFLEETDLKVSVLPDFVSVQERISDKSHTVLVFKHVTCDNATPLEAKEGFSQVRWFSKEEIPLNTTEMTRAALHEFFQ